MFTEIDKLEIRKFFELEDENRTNNILVLKYLIF